MKRVMLLLLSVTCCLTALSGCQKAPASETSTDKTSEAESVTQSTDDETIEVEPMPELAVDEAAEPVTEPAVQPKVEPRPEQTPASPPQSEIPADSAFNTEDGEADFLKITEIGTEQISLDPTKFKSESCLLQDGTLYSFAIYLHNTSDQAQKNVVLMLAYPEIIKAGQLNRVDATLSWGDEKHGGVIADSLNLGVPDDRVLALGDDGEGHNIVISDRRDQIPAKPDSSVTVYEKTLHVIQLGEIAADDGRWVYFVFGSVNPEAQSADEPLTLH